MKVAQIGNGFVGNALSRSFKENGINTVIYDKFQKIGSIKDVLNSDVIFLCLPTPFVVNRGFDLSAIEENLKILSNEGYGGLCVIKSTVEVGVVKMLSKRYGLNIVHNPEFLTERTAFEDFHNQKHIVLGRVYESKSFDDLILFYKSLYPDASISVCTSDESEAMKLFCNNFYAMKVMIFNEFYFFCASMGIEYNSVKNLMLKNDWINPNHTLVPGPDGKVAYGGNCFCKDTEALLAQMKKSGILCGVLEAAIHERNILRQDVLNIVQDKEED